MEENTHISYFKVENFKRFESFEMENIGKFNLIVGDNNVGKTTVLEALLLDGKTNRILRNLSVALEERDLIYDNIDQAPSKIFNNYLNKKGANKTIKSIFRYIRETDNKELYTASYSIKNKKDIGVLTDDLKNKILLNANMSELIEVIVDSDAGYNVINTLEFPSTKDNFKYVPLISIKGGYIEDMADHYDSYILKSNNLKRQLLADIQKFAPSIWDIELTDDVSCMIARHKDYDVPLPITQLGEGVVKFIKILIGIIIQRNKSLMIDEIDAGIYHGRFKQFWKTILLSAQTNNVQLYATTHSQECLKFIKEVLEEDDELKGFQNDMRCFRLVEKQDKSVASVCYDFEQFQFAIDHENEIR
jgi:AAA15 family ATPase/GTPase